MSTAVATAMAHPDKYKKDFDTIVAILTQYIDKRVPTPSVMVAYVGHSRPAKRQKTSATCGTFKGKIELKKYSREKCDSMSMEQHLLLHDLLKEARLIKGNKTPESSRALDARVAAQEAKTDNSSNESLFPDKKPKANNRKNPALDRKGSGTRQSHTDT